MFTALRRLRPPAVVFLVLLSLPIVMQYLHLLDVKEVRHWLEVFAGPYRVNAAIIILFFLCFYILFNSIFIALSATTVFCLTFSIVDMQKMHILHQPLLPSDLFFFKQALFIARIYAGQALAGCLAIATVVIGTFMLRNKIRSYGLPLSARLVVATMLGVTITGGVLKFDDAIAATSKRFKIVNEFWDQLSNYKKNGVFYGFLLNSTSLKITKPPHYGKKAIDRIFFYDSTTVALPEPRSPAGPPPIPPDVIIYMNESFWDITQISSIKPPRDPIPVFHSIGKRRRKTRLVSPTFGGNTCLAEFEILTGMSHGYFPSGSIAYNQFIRRPVPSVVRVFKENGYKTLGIHDFKRWFWNRDNVYRYFGFDNFISDDSMKQEPLKGTYIGDEALARIIVRHAAAEKGPEFIFAMSMQNHGHYSYKRYDSLDCPVTTGLSGTADLEYNTYFQGLIDADKSLKIIIEYIKSTKKPTLLLFFGDHLPGFTHLYKESGYEQVMAGNMLKTYSTTAVWYANFPLPPMKDSAVSMVYVPLLIAQAARIKIPAYYRLMDGIRSQYPIFTQAKRLDGTGRTIPPTAETKAQDAACRMILYDALFGKKYADRYHHVAGPSDTVPPLK